MRIALIKVFVASLYVLTALLAQNSAAETYQEGTHYKTLETPLSVPMDGKVHVEEFFWYGCPHCFKLEPAVEAWLKNKPEDVVFSKTAVQFSRTWKLHARLFYVADSLGVLEKVNTTIFRAIHVDKKKLLSKSQQRDFMVEYAGISEKEFDKAYDSFSVVNSMKRASARVKQAALRGVPSIIVNGKYLVSSSVPGGHDNLFNVVNFLIEKERKALQ